MSVFVGPTMTIERFKDVDMEDDEFTIVYSTLQAPQIANDTITMNYSMIANSQVCM